MMASDYRSPAATAFSPWGKMPLATVEIPTGAHRDLGGSECASVKSFRLFRYEANSSERDGACQNQSRADQYRNGAS